MIHILDVTCSSPALAVTLRALKKILLVVQIVGPILLIASLVIKVTNLMATPDDKKLPKKIFNSILATLLLFFIPLLIDLAMGMMGQNFSISACWNSIQN